MSKSLRSVEIRNADAIARELGFAERELIENASSNLCGVIDTLKLGKKALIVAGRGNNGADALSCGRKLAGRGYKVQTAVIGSKEANNECLFQASVLKRLGIPVVKVRDNRAALRLKAMTEESDFIIDGIFGIGIKGIVDSFAAEIIEMMNMSRKPIVACDIPSGLCPDTGKILGKAIRAWHTVTFIASKKGFFVNQGPAVCGTIYVVDIGISYRLLQKVNL